MGAHWQAVEAGQFEEGREEQQMAVEEGQRVGVAVHLKGLEWGRQELQELCQEGVEALTMELRGLLRAEEVP